MCSHCKHFFFWMSLDKDLKQKGFLILRHFFRRSFNFFYASLFMFEEIFCRIAWITFIWIVVLFSFHSNSHKTNYICKECKKELKTSHWFNNVCFRLISISILELFWTKVWKVGFEGGWNSFQVKWGLAEVDVVVDERSRYTFSI